MIRKYDTIFKLRSLHRDERKEKKAFKSAGQQFHQYHQNEQLQLTFKKNFEHKSNKYGIGNSVPSLEHTQKCNGDKPVNKISTL